MEMKIIARSAVVGLATALLAACSGGNQWHLKGNIADLGEQQIAVVEGNNQGYWYLMDTLKVDKNGKFDYSHEAQGYPDIYRVRVGNSSVYFPIDSVETVTLEATAPDISENHVLGGTPQAQNLAKVDSIIRVASANGGDAVVNDEQLKRELGKIILADPAGVVSYYVICKTVGNKPLFNPTVALDRRFLGAVANAFSENRPGDPRTSYLKKLYVNNRPTVNPRSMEANVVSSWDINLYDEKGTERRMLQLNDEGKVILLSFTAYGTEFSIPYNVELNRIYEKYRDRGLEIYQVSVDEDEYRWKEIAKNLPWITVLNNAKEGARNLLNYNVQTIPTAFVINREGEIVERISDVKQMENQVSKHL